LTEKSAHISDATCLFSPSRIVLATAKGLFLGATKDLQFGAISAFQGKDIRCVKTAKREVVILAFFNCSDFTVFDLALNTALSIVPNPSSDKYPCALLPLGTNGSS
jgi:hypothetical protein